MKVSEFGVELKKISGRIKVSDNFYLDEYIDPVTYFTLPDHGLSLMDPSVFAVNQLLRDLLGKPITINNWWEPFWKWAKDHPDKTVQDFSKFYTKKGNYQFSGFRPSWCKVGAKASAHRKGKAADPKGNEKKLYSIVKDNAMLFYEKGLRRLEDPKITKGWLHNDTLERNTKPNSIRVVDLSKCTETIYF